MIEQRFTVFRDEHNKSKGVYDNLTQRKVYQWGHIARLLNIFNSRYTQRVSELTEENEQLKKELQKIYEIATVNKVRDIVENVYDDLLYETSDESDYARTKVLKCLEDIDILRDDLE